jgi:hypothetical protein
MVAGNSVARNGTDVAPAVITRVWSDTMLNVTAFPDSDAPTRVTSIQLFPDEDAARAWIAEEQYRSVAAYWPPRINEGARS